MKIAGNLKNIVLVLSLALVLAACGGKAKKAAKATANGTAEGQIVDMTRPPALIKSADKIEAESNPDETISYDEWSRRRATEQEAVKEVTPKPDE